MNSNVEEVDGILMTKCDYPSPTTEWTNIYELMGGDSYWSQVGKVPQLLHGSGVHGEAKPIFALGDEIASSITLFEVDGTFYFFSAGDECVQKITYPRDLGEIIGTLGDPDSGFDDISTADI
ncbi:hypothetical protein NW768_012055 [Fusarium equiseti]|uniref:Uncharacterized protein n=1 Tax=Fusarium equiseti TaxID=61235 RepID=A0ABQ8QWB9_FUSEQ|nr:hypothetical protein NW768_012055 [Fusarium equiseti]